MTACTALKCAPPALLGLNPKPHGIETSTSDWRRQPVLTAPLLLLHPRADPQQRLSICTGCLTSADGQRGIGHHLPPAAARRRRWGRELVRAAPRAAIARLRRTDAMGSAPQRPARAAAALAEQATMPPLLTCWSPWQRARSPSQTRPRPRWRSAGHRPGGPPGRAGSEGPACCRCERVLNVTCNACGAAGLGVCRSRACMRPAWSVLDFGRPPTRPWAALITGRHHI